MGRVTRFLQASNQATTVEARVQTESVAEPIDPELKRVMKSWPTLPRNVKRAILELLPPRAPGIK